MHLKKLFCTLAVCTLLTGAAATTAFAHHGRHYNYNYNSTSRTTYTACSVEDCIETGRHYHDGTCYYGHTSDNNQSGYGYGCGGHRGYCH